MIFLTVWVRHTASGDVPSARHRRLQAVGDFDKNPLLKLRLRSIAGLAARNVVS